MSEATELTKLPPKETALQVYQTPKGLDPYIERIRQEVTGHEVDLTTKKGRDAIASRAFGVRKIKTALDNLGKEQVDRLKEIPKLVDAERKRMRETLDALANEVRAPLDEWEAAEEARIKQHKENIAVFAALVINSGERSYEISASIASVHSIVVGPEWEEFETEARRAKETAWNTLHEKLAAREKYEAEQAELAELRLKQAAQEKKDHEARIAQEAADKTRREAEALAQAEREAATRREQEAKAAADRRELELKLQAEQAEKAAAQAKADKIAAEQRAEQERLAAIERQKQAEARAEAETLAAEQRAKDAAEAARQAEIKRQADAKAAAQAEQLRREKDTAHKKSVNNAALAAFIENGLSESCAKQAVVMIIKGLIPAVKITY